MVRKAFCATFKNVDLSGKEITKSNMLKFLLEAAEIEEKAIAQGAKLEEKVQKFINSPPGTEITPAPTTTPSTATSDTRELPSHVSRGSSNNNFVKMKGFTAVARESHNPYWRLPPVRAYEDGEMRNRMINIDYSHCLDSDDDDSL